MKNYRVGDRFAFKYDNEFVIEVLSKGRERLVSNSNNRHNYNVGLVASWGPYDNIAWVYLGNFAKSDNFENLYDKLNNECN